MGDGRCTVRLTCIDVPSSSTSGQRFRWMEWIGWSEGISVIMRRSWLELQGWLARLTAQAARLPQHVQDNAGVMIITIMNKVICNSLASNSTHQSPSGRKRASSIGTHRRERHNSQADQTSIGWIIRDRAKKSECRVSSLTTMY
jgi:hypothetical protein